MKPEHIELEGKWSAIKKHVRELLADGWHFVVEPTGEPEFRFTTVVMER